MQSKSFRAAALATVFAMGAAASYHAHAADLGGGSYGHKYEPLPAPPPPAYTKPVDYSQWAGFYFGGVLGYNWADLGGDNEDLSGLEGGGLLGYNYQMGNFVAGIEGDLIALGNDGSTSVGGETLDASGNWSGAVRGRLGVTLMPELLVFATLGYNWADYDTTLSGPFGGDASHTFSGLQYGGGAEVKLSENWSARVDYLHTDFDAKTLSYSGGSDVTVDPDSDEVRGALVFHF